MGYGYAESQQLLNQVNRYTGNIRDKTASLWNAMFKQLDSPDVGRQWVALTDIDPQLKAKQLSYKVRSPDRVVDEKVLVGTVVAYSMVK